MYARKKSCGIGNKILTYLEEQAKELGYNRIVLETRKCNENAVIFYLNNGYQAINNYGKYKIYQKQYVLEKIFDTNCHNCLRLRFSYSLIKTAL